MDVYFKELRDLFGTNIGPFEPHAMVIPQLHMISALTRDCSFCAHPIHSVNMFDILKDNFGGQETVGFQIWCADEIVRRTIAIRQRLELPIDVIPLDHLLAVTQTACMYELGKGIPEAAFAEVRALANQYRLVLTRDEYAPLLLTH